MPLYRWSADIPVDYECPDDELAVTVMNSLKECPRLCSLMVMAQSLQPQSKPLGEGFVDLDVQVGDIYWGALRFLSISPEEPKEKGALQEQNFRPAPCYTRTIDEIFHLQSVNSRYHECKAWILACKFILSKVTLVGIPATCPWKEVPVNGKGADLPSTSMRHHSKKHPKVLPNPDSRKEWRLYGEGVSFLLSEQADNLWTLRVSLSVIWEFVQSWTATHEWSQIEPCPYACVRPSRTGSGGI